ncbi:hypothetical protein [Pseudoalteromonas mariniglutinosa]|uniref:hypothetical protein n=1 Tax=Pseudoalteromonas mariniglutinosa TaxID=206042 RepID=UPI00384E860D
MLRHLKIVKWRANKQLKQQQDSWLHHKTRLFRRGQAIWFNLNTAQKLYLLALLSLIIFRSSWLCTSITIVALVIEFWPKFNQLWHSLAGKALILIFYAIIANFVLASASGIVNDVTHVSASNFNYTHNFATLLYLPPWALGFTLATLLGLQLFLPFYIVALLLIKPFGSERVKFISQSYSPLLTACVRFILAAVVLINLISFVDDKSPTDVVDDIISSYESGQALAHNTNIESELAVEELSKKIQQQIPDVESKTSEQQRLNIDIEADNEDKASESVQQIIDTKGYFERSKWLIAMFAYSFEADSYSRCKKAEGSKAVELNDYEIVQIKPDNNKPYGYNFKVIACESAGIKVP